MTEIEILHKEAMDMLLATSRTFFIPIHHLPSGLQEAIAAAYLCMRAIDEIEDHPTLPSDIKIHLLRSISLLLEESAEETELAQLLQPYHALLPDVTLRLADWIKLSPSTITPNILKSTAIMSTGMADWVAKEWKITSQEDLDDYTFYVAGLVGILLSEVWKWFNSHVETDQKLAVAFGRGLQAVNIIRNRDEDLARGTDFFPDGWTKDDMFAYARRNLELANQYVGDIESGPVLTFCRIPLLLAHGTLDALARGEEKLSRAAVESLVNQVTEGK